MDLSEPMLAGPFLNVFRIFTKPVSSYYTSTEGHIASDILPLSTAARVNVSMRLGAGIC